MRRLALAALALLATQAWPGDEPAGRRLYLDAVTPGGEPLAALIGFEQTPLAGRAIACGNCHGADGRGRPEAAVLPPNIRWEELTKPYGHAHATGRKHGPFSEATFLRAVNEGIDPAGNRLDPAMPRYALSHSEAEALLGYLKRLGEQKEPGIGERSLRIGAVLPGRARGAAAGAMQAALSAYAASLNKSGGVHQRRVELVVAHGVAEARERFSAEPVFALINPSESDDPDLGRFAAASKLPVVASLGAAQSAMPDGDPLLFRVLPGLEQEAAVLVEFAARRAGGSPLHAAIVASGAPSDELAAQAARRRCAARGCGDALRIGWYARGFEARAAVKRIKTEGRSHVFFFGAADEFMKLVREAGRQSDGSWRPTIYAPGTLVGAALAVRASFAGDLFLAFPESPGAGSAGAWQELKKEYALGTRHEAAQMAALAAAVVLTEGLRRAGRDLTRERLVQALESLNNYDPLGYAPAVSFGPGRRTGALGAYVVALDARRGFVPASGWIALE